MFKLGGKGDFNEGSGTLSQGDAQKQVPWAALLLRAKPRRVKAADSVIAMNKLEFDTLYGEFSEKHQ